MVRVGVIGCGAMGANHARIYSMMKGTEFVGVFDVDSKKARAVAAKYNTKAYADYRELMDKVDAVSIVVPTAHHYELAKECLEAGLDVLLEKPITETVAQADELIAIAGTGGRILQIGHVERFNPAILELANIVTKPVHIEARRFSPYDARISSGIVLDLMVHDLDIVMNLAGSPIKSVKSMCANVKDDSPTEDLAQVSIMFENGVTASLIASRVHQNKVRQLNIAEADAYITVDYMKQELVIYRYVSADMIQEGEVKYRQEVITEIPFLQRRGEPLWIELDHFVNAVEERSEPLVTGTQGRDVLKAALDIVVAGAS
ncbi:MAG: Gfo/Idh/MocA family oxidoreductase [Actinomycetota bacterium]